MHIYSPSILNSVLDSCRTDRTIYHDCKRNKNEWELEKRIREDKRATGVVVTNSRSKMIDNILDLLHEGAITLDDLSDFSEELQEKIQFLYDTYKLSLCCSQKCILQE